jgi:hypothetical protein
LFERVTENFRLSELGKSISMGGVERPPPVSPCSFALGVADCPGRIFAITLSNAANFTTRPSPNRKRGSSQISRGGGCLDIPADGNRKFRPPLCSALFLGERFYRNNARRPYARKLHDHLAILGPGKVGDIGRLSKEGSSRKSLEFALIPDIAQTKIERA